MGFLHAALQEASNGALVKRSKMMAALEEVGSDESSD
jgi:hypothetical protein